MDKTNRKQRRIDRRQKRDKVYTRINWKNKSDAQTTPLNDANLNKMDYALNEVDTRVVDMDSQKQNKLTAGDNITIEGDVISATGGGSVTEYGTTAEFEEHKDQFEEGTEYLITDDYEQPETYSEEETLIGTYNDRPLYRRVVKLTSTTTGEHRLPYDLSFVLEMLKVDAMANGYIGNGANFNSFSNWGFCFSDWNASGFNIYKGTRYGNFEVRFIIEYTKTTD